MLANSQAVGVHFLLNLDCILQLVSPMREVDFLADFKS